MSKKTQIPHKFSKSFIENLSITIPDGGQKIYKDIDKRANGLMLRHNTRGSVVYVVSGRIKGSKKQSQFFTIGNASKISLLNARREAERYHDLMNQGKHPVEYLKRTITSISLRELHEHYLENKNLHEDTINEYIKDFERLSVKFRECNALDIRRDDVVDEHKAVKVKHTDYMADKTFQRVNALYRHGAKHFLDDEELSIFKKNPVKVLDDTDGWYVNGGQSRRKTECIDTDDLPSVLRAIDDMKSFRGEKKFVHKDSHNAIVASHFFRFLLFTGWRPEEVCKITWSQVSESLKDVSWNDEEAAEGLKNAEVQYRAPLNKEAIKTLESIKNYNFKSNFVFPNVTLTNHFKQNPTDYVNLLEETAQTGKRYTCGIFRKTFQTYAEFIGVHEVTIKRLVFHTQKHYTTQGGYIFANREHLRRQSQRVADFILYYAKMDELIEFQNVDISVKFIEAARAEVKDESNDFQLVSEVLEHWMNLGRKFDQMR
ncbi:integrase arm-type DNA-binding domain-containing protein [Vibrio crassostreae]|uniref:integrase arm-type DNA-binding domain-containing protein n=1 Tax=Vibrio crassostreae TaxID=246167 RepID=UPI001B30EFF3